MAIELDKYKDTYISEAKGYIAQMNQNLLELEKQPQEKKLINEIFRQAHTFKSMAATMGYNNTVTLCHAVEDVLSELRDNRITLNDCADLLFASFDLLDRLLEDVQNNRKESDVTAITASLQQAAHLEAQALELASSKLTSQDSSTVFRKVRRVDITVENLDALMRLVEELTINKINLDHIKNKLTIPEFTKEVERFDRLVADIQYRVMQLRLIPIRFIFNRFPRMIRDIAKEQHKKVELQMEVADIELDRAIVDEIGESLVHILRNAVGHGVETIEKRKKLGKPECAIIKLRATKSKSHVIIEITDDGCGLDLIKIKLQALKRGIIDNDATEKEIANSIFSGVSTAGQVTTVSGRGIGLSVVQDKISSLGGAIMVESKLYHGTKFIIEVPLTIAMIKALFVKIGALTLAIPVTNVERLVTVNKNDIKYIMNFESIVVKGENIPITRLAVLFNAENKHLNEQPIVIISRNNEKLGLVVDSFGDAQEVVVKPLDKLIKENHYFSGSAIVGSGEVVLILDVANLILSKREFALQNRQNVLNLGECYETNSAR